MIWLTSLTLKRLHRLTLQRHHYEQLSYESRAQIDAETAEAMKRKMDMNILRVQSRLLSSGVSQQEISDYLAMSQEVSIAREKAARARRLPI